MDRSDEKVSRVRGNFNRLARDLDRAIRGARFSDAQTFLLSEARELSWSFAGQEPFPFCINFSACSRLHGYEPSWLSKQFRLMIRMKIFIDIGDGSFLINKRYVDWLRPDGKNRRLSDEQIKWCKQILRKGRIGLYSTESGPGGAPPRVPLPTTRSDFNVHGGVPPRSLESTTGSSGSALPCPDHPPLKPPCKDRAPEFTRVNLKRGEEEKLKGDCTPQTSAPPPISAAPLRTSEDATLVAKAASMLCSDIRTEHLGLELRRLDGLPEMLAIPGWKWVRAAERILSPDIPDAKRRRWPYFLGIARSITDDERHAPARPTRNGRHPAPVPLPPPAREVTNGRHVNLVPPRPRSKPDSRKEPDARD
jgi:hypothetical protein